MALKTLVLTFLLLSLMQAAPPASACGTYPEPRQSQLDAANLERERTLASATAHRSELVFVGTVESLQRPKTPGEVGQVTLRVTETLKGDAPALVTLPWKGDRFVVSCKASDSFLNAGFREDWNFIVYVADGTVVRSAHADRSPYRASLSFVEERAMLRGSARSTR